MSDQDRIEELNAENRQLLKRAQQAEAALQEAVAREADLKNDVPVGGIERMLQRAISMQEELRGELEQAVAREATLVKTLDAFETHILHVAELRGVLRAALTPLEAVTDALVPPGARVEEAAALVDEALTVIHEELE